jgi:hypothetical protein
VECRHERGGSLQDGDTVGEEDAQCLGECSSRGEVSPPVMPRQELPDERVGGWFVPAVEPQDRGTQRFVQQLIAEGITSPASPGSSGFPHASGGSSATASAGCTQQG